MEVEGVDLHVFSILPEVTATAGGPDAESANSQRLTGEPGQPAPLEVHRLPLQLPPLLRLELEDRRRAGSE
jgi:hypothetical protein